MICNTRQRSSTRYAMALRPRTRLGSAIRPSGIRTQSQRPSHARPSPRATRAPKAERRNARAAYARLVGPWRLRVESDAEGFSRTRCLYGWIEYYDERRVAVYTEHPRIAKRLLGIRGVLPHQMGDVERRVLIVPRVALAAVVRIMRAHRRQQVSAKSLDNLRPFRTSRSRSQMRIA
jgi:hypothetical protein